MAQNQYLKVPVSMPDASQHLRLISNTVNNTLDGKLNSTGTITLRQNQTTTTLADARIGLNSIILFMTMTANGNTANLIQTVTAIIANP